MKSLLKYITVRRMAATAAGIAASLLAMVPLPAKAAPKVPDALSNPMVQILVVIALMLLICIALLGYVLNGAAHVFKDKLQEKRKSSGNTAGVIVAVLLLAASNPVLAQDAAVPQTINGLTPAAFYLLVGVIIFEILVIIAMVLQLRFLAGLKTYSEPATVVAKATVPAKPKTSWWWKINNSVSIDKESEIDLSHDYDGISELDNKVPPWWQLAFLLSFLFGVVYVYRYHVAHSAPLQLEEFNIAMKEGEAQRQAYLRQSASNVDENTITVMDAAAIGAGKSVYDANCVACHGSMGEGNAVGPNLTDKYWIHGGDIKDIFKTVKYGWPEKGMQSWKEILSPIKMAQVANYVHSLQGTNPPNAKEAQGELYAPEASPENAAANSDSTATGN